MAVSNCFGRILNIILNNRLDSFLLENSLIHESQIGFSNKACTSDHLFVLKCLIDKFINDNHKKQTICMLCRVGKKVGNNHISQDGGKYWEIRLILNLQI